MPLLAHGCVDCSRQEEPSLHGACEETSERLTSTASRAPQRLRCASLESSLWYTGDAFHQEKIALELKTSNSLQGPKGLV